MSGSIESRSFDLPIVASRYMSLRGKIPLRDILSSHSNSSEIIA